MSIWGVGTKLWGFGTGYLNIPPLPKKKNKIDVRAFSWLFVPGFLHEEETELLTYLKYARAGSDTGFNSLTKGMWEHTRQSTGGLYSYKTLRTLTNKGLHTVQQEI